MLLLSALLALYYSMRVIAELFKTDTVVDALASHFTKITIFIKAQTVWNTSVTIISFFVSLLFTTNGLYYASCSCWSAPV